MSLFIGLLLFAIALFFTALLRSYEQTPVKELRRQARAGDELARALYRVVSYGHSLRAFLIGLTLIANAALFIFIARAVDPWLATFIVATMLWAVYVWLPRKEMREHMVRIAAGVAPAMSSVLGMVHPLFDRIHQWWRQRRPIHFHTGLYEEDDIVQLLEAQADQPDNRIPASVTHIAISALTFANVPVREVMTPRRVVRSVSVEDTVGPVLLSELHDSGFSRFPVHGENEEEVVGVLFLRDMVTAKSGGKISKLMTERVCYVHEEQSIKQALDAIIKTHQQLFIVVNSFEEYVGVVSIEDILERVLGQAIVDEFDQYEDMRAVAASQAKKDRTSHEHPAADNPPNHPPNN
jgi:CBS domain containing-hemolysin-like protein